MEMERRFEVLTALVGAEDKIRGEYNTIEEIKVGIEEMYETLYSLKKDFGKSLALNELLQNLKSLESGKKSPQDITVGNLLKEIIRKG